MGQRANVVKRCNWRRIDSTGIRKLAKKNIRPLKYYPLRMVVITG
jgi:hypothetical protein